MKGFDSSAAAIAGLLDSLDVIAWVADAGTLRGAYVNGAGAATLGFPRERWLQEPPFWPALLHAADREAMLDLCAAVARDGAERTQIHRVADSSGVERWFRTKIRRLASPDDGSPQLLGEMVEVTRLVREREVARKNQVWLDLMLEQVPAVIWTLDRDLVFTSGAGSGLTRLGVRPEDWIGLRLEDFLRMGDSTGPDMPEHRRALQGEALHYQGHFLDRVYDSYVEPLRSGDQIVGVIGIAFDVTERATAEQQQRLAEERYQQIVETSEEGIWTIDADGVTTFANQKMGMLLGCPASEVVGRSMFDLMDPSHRSAAEEHLRRRKEGIRERHPFPLRRADGSELWVEMSTSPIYDEGGRFTGALAMVSDISARREAEAERERLLRESNSRRELLEVVLEHAPVGIFVLRGPEFLVKVANPAARALAPGKRFEGRRWYDVSPELAPFRPGLEEVLKTGKTTYLVDQPTTVRTTEDGPLKQMWFSSTRVRIQLPDGAPGILLLVNDTSQAMSARLEIDQITGISYARAAQLQAVLENMADSVTVYGAGGNVSFANRATFELLGLVPAELIDQSSTRLCELLDPRDLQGRPVPVEAMPPVRALAGETLTVELSVAQAATGRRIAVRASASPLKDPLGRITGAVTIARDVTAAFELERLKDQFIEVAAHELKSPVAIMKTNAQLLLETGGGLSPIHLRMARAIDRGATRIDKIVQNLLDISQLQLNTLVLTSVEVDLATLTQRVVQRCGQAAPTHPIRLTTGGPALVRGDPHRLEWILVRLIDNAIQHSADGGAVDVEIAAQAGVVTLSVHDSGEGIPLDRQSRIFERFYRAHTRTPRDVGGLGISLHIAREIIRRLGGELWFKSEPGKGATFSVRLPAGKAP